MTSLYVALSITVVVIFILAKIALVVPQQSAFVVERLGKYSRTVHAGFHILIPFIERVAYRHTLKEQAADIAEQVCITKDNVQVGVDAGTGCQPSFIRHRRLHVCDCTAGANDVA